MRRANGDESNRWWKTAGFAAAFLFLGLQAAPVAPPRVNPPVERKLTVHADPSVPQPVKEILGRSCMNCHSNATMWPWYSRVAPASWFVAQDVADGRQALNFSEWGAKKPPVQAALAAAACANVRSGKMPLPRYLLLHPGARLSEAEKDILCAWSEDALRSLARPRQTRTTE